MLHEEVELIWNELQCIIEDVQLLEDLRSSLVIGVSIVQSFKSNFQFIISKAYYHHIIPIIFFT